MDRGVHPRRVARARRLKRIARQEDDERFRQLWPFFAWSALAAYVDFWNRVGRRHEIAEPDMTNVIVPTHDYQTGARIVSLAAVREHDNLVAMLRYFRERSSLPAEQAHPVLAGLVGWDQLFASLLEIVGEDEGARLLREVLHREGTARRTISASSLRSFLVTSRREASCRCASISRSRATAAGVRCRPDPTPQARARTLQEFWDTYGLARSRGVTPRPAPGSSSRRSSRAPRPRSSRALKRSSSSLRRRKIDGDALIDAITELRSRLDVAPDDDYFLARLSFPYLRPEDAAGFVHAVTGGRSRGDIVVTLEDHDGVPFQVRHALSPKEVGRLHRLFVAAKLDVSFRAEHQYLVAVNDRGILIGGIFYEMEDEGRSAHLEKIVVAGAPAEEAASPTAS